MHRRNVILSGAAGIVAASGFARWQGRDSQSGISLVSAARAQDTGALPDVQEMTKGSPDAPVTLIEYASYTCPHCRTFHENTLPQLERDYIDTGLVRFVYREVYFDRYGLWAGMVARCGGPLRYFGIVDLIYEQQSEWTQGGPAEIAQNLRRIGRTAGLSNEELDACMADADMAQALINNYEANIETHQIGGTPSFVINDELHGNMSYDDMRALIDDALEAAG